MKKKNYKIKFIGARGPFTDYDGKSIPNVEVDKSDFPKIRKKYNIKEKEYEEMIYNVGVWKINKRTNDRAFVFVSTNGTPKLIVITENFLKELLNKYK